MSNGQDLLAGFCLLFLASVRRSRARQLGRTSPIETVQSEIVHCSLSCEAGWVLEFGSIHRTLLLGDPLPDIGGAVPQL